MKIYRIEINNHRTKLRLHSSLITYVTNQPDTKHFINVEQFYVDNKHIKDYQLGFRIL